MDLNVRDLITIVILSVIMLIIQFLVGSITAFNVFVSMVLSSAIICFLNATVFLLMSARVKKRGLFLIYTLLMSVAYVIMGYWFLFPVLLAIGLVGEFVIMRGENSYESMNRVTGLWTYFSFTFVFISVIPIAFLWDMYSKIAEAGGFSEEYLDAAHMYFTDPLWLLVIFALTTVCGFLGCLFGRKLMKKHFEKAGMI